MNISPSLRTALTAVVAMLAAIAVVLPTLGAPVWVAAIIGALLAGAAAVGIIPPQTGGTQVGVASPSLTTPPAVQTPDEGAGVVVEQRQQRFDDL